MSKYDKDFYVDPNFTKPMLTGLFDGIKGKKGLVNIEKPGFYEKRALKRIKIGDIRCGNKDVCWKVISLRPFKILVISGGHPYGQTFEAEITRREFLDFGDPIK